ncbi:single-stranded DNA-binding protein [Clostridium beijerinckii]|uniref:single-stranded DNA-binding protein n=3 Tax=Clostridium beijerinckii TaxID=1520 RepID=UPI00136EE4EA|nr:single-stranded DNA-binding protein [Clostridium beijerinckii]MZL11788.1 single-stranded DNA-binding protein [Clostridium beijerinckii]MZL21633.1 single-stranded DNA-binding protein [Clostridium beijerinckii]
MNKVILIGRLTKDPDLRFLPGSGAATTSITLAVDKYNTKTGQKEADFVPVVIWGKQAESTANYMRKGHQMAIFGKIQTRNYENKDGKKVYVTEVVAQEVKFLSKAAQAQSQNSFNDDPYKGLGDDDLERVEDDGTMPF